MASKRRKPEGGLVITTLDQADEALAAVSRIDRELAKHDRALNEAITKAKEKAEAAAAPLRAERDRLGNALKAFAETTKSDNFTKKKSRSLLHGVLGFRSSSKLATLKGFTWKKVLDAVHAMASSLEDWATFGNCVRPKYELDKEAVKKLTEADMARIGCTVKTEDEFFYETKTETVAEKAA